MCASFNDTTTTNSRVYEFLQESRTKPPVIERFEKEPLVSLEEAVKPLNSVVSELDQMVWTVIKNCNRPKDGLSKDESASIMLYTLQWLPRERSFYYMLNTILLSGDQNKLKPWHRYLRLFTFALSKLPPSPSKIVFRGIDKDMREEFPVEKIFFWWPFTSCTSSIEFLQNYIGKTGKKTIFLIESIAAKDISRHSIYPTENELLLYPARQFRVISSNSTENNQHIIHLKEIEYEHSFFPIPSSSSDNAAKISQPPNSNSTTSPSQLPASNKDTPSNTIIRTAMDASGRLGSFYDIHRDLICASEDVPHMEKISKDLNTTKCRIIKSGKNSNENILKTIGVEDDLRLSTLLNMEEKTGLAAIIDDPNQTDENTRFLYYSYRSRSEQLQYWTKAQSVTKSFKVPTNVTHVITTVRTGICIIAILQLPYDSEQIVNIDRALDQVRILLENSDDISKITSQEQKLLKEIEYTKIYSNIPDLENETTLLDVCYQITKRKKKTINDSSSYGLRPIEDIYSDCSGQNVTFISLPSIFADSIEQYVFQLRNSIKKIEIFMKNKLVKLSFKHLKKRSSLIKSQWSNVNNQFETEIGRLRKLVIDIRRNRVQSLPATNQILNTDEQKLLDDNIRNLTQKLTDLEEKGHFINDLYQQHFHYYSVIDSDIDATINERNIERKLVQDERYDRFLCSNDTLNKTNSKQIEKMRRSLIDEFKENDQLRLVYVDFSDSSCKLSNIMILPSDEYQDEHHASKPKEKTSTKESQRSTASSRQSPTSMSTPTRSQASDNDTINIILLGETGVGKSTFINALINYLLFKSFKQAESNEPVVAIPVSFFLSVGDKFEQRIVKFGDPDNSKNENFNNVGQSVTQNCQSYIFNLNYHNKKRIRIIDTPGFGDTRGSNQTDRNMQHILEYINNLNHIDAICFLLKSNKSELDNYFQACVTQIFRLLNTDARSNIIFCFTNGRITFYQPGDTAPLLLKTLASLSIVNIPFKKENTFCFDNEAFRYLVALQNRIPFTNEEKKEYESSWSVSTTQANRLLDYICTKLVPYNIEDEECMIKRIEIEILNMIRPLLETIRNILRNDILSKNSSNVSIEMHPKYMKHPITICLSCRKTHIQVDRFWIIDYLLHDIEKRCSTCKYSVNEHDSINYSLKYECSNKSSEDDQDKMLNELIQATIEFSNFLLNVARYSNDDPFMSYLLRMINEENDICENQTSVRLNDELLKDLKKLKCDYERQMDRIKSNEDVKKISFIHKRIKKIRNYSTICEQMNAIQKAQENMMKQSEHEIPTDLTCTLVHPSSRPKSSPK